MSHLLICGAAGYTNLGDDAILWGMVTQLRAVVGGREIRVVGGPELESLTTPLGAAAISYEDPEEVARGIEGADLVVLGGGGMLYDVGYDASLARFLGDLPDRPWLYELARIAAAARAAGKPVMVYGMGVGPLLTEAGQRVARFIADQASAVTVRDEGSAGLLVACGVARTRVQVAGDPAAGLTAGPAEAAEALLGQIGVAEAPRPWVAMNVRPWYRFGGIEEGPAEAREQFVERLAAVVRGVRGQLGGTALLIPFQRLRDDDRETMGQVLEAAGEKAGAMVVKPRLTPPLAVGLLKRCDVMVGMRLHSLLLAVDAGLPFAAVSYAPKVTEFVRAVRMTEHLHAVDDLDPAAVLQSCKVLLTHAREVQEVLAERSMEMRGAAGISAQLAASVLENAGAARVASVPAATAAKSTGAIRVLMQIRPDYREAPGGDVVQLEEMMPYLREAGVTAELTGEEAPDLSPYDLVHAINLDRPEESYRHCLNAVRQGKPVVVSTVHDDLSELLEWSDTDYWKLPAPEEGLPRAQPAPPPDPIERRKRARRNQQRQAIIDWATVYLPNARVNAQYLHEAFGMDVSRAVVVPNGVREIFFEASPEAFAEKYGLRDFVLCVGRVESKKNQLSLVAAMRGTGIPLVIVGRPNPEAYRQLCRRYADDNVRFIDSLSEEELASAYAAAKVHALVSWIELPGLTTLEAGAAGCNIVTTDRGSPPEYLRGMAWYCEPGRVESIRAAVLAAYEAPRSEEVRRQLRQHCTWRLAAERTVEGYRLALALEAGRTEGQRLEATLEATRRHADWLARLAADREYEARRYREWGEDVESELKRLQEEFRQVTSRRLHRWSAGVASGVWRVLRALGVKR